MKELGAKFDNYLLRHPPSKGVITIFGDATDRENGDERDRDPPKEGRVSPLLQFIDNPLGDLKTDRLNNGDDKPEEEDNSHRSPVSEYLATNSRKRPKILLNF